jgi:type II secretory pathway predicted ATPase ExeA
MTTKDKREIVNLIQTEKRRSGSYRIVATKAGVSAATISNMINHNWELIREGTWSKVASVVNYSTSIWKLVETTNFRTVTNTANRALNESLFIGIAAPAGSGKSEALQHLAKKSNGIVYIEAREWAKREFLRNLSQELGLQNKYYHTGNQLETDIIKYFIKNSHEPQMLIVDQANSLKLSAIKFFIHLYNAMKDKMGIVLAGTDALEGKIKRGVEHNQNGFDEVDSRMGRNFIHLLGNTFNDVKAICEANNIIDKDIIQDIFTEAQPAYMTFKGKSIKVVKDLRRVERIVKRELSHA